MEKTHRVGTEKKKEKQKSEVGQSQSREAGQNEKDHRNGAINMKRNRK